MIESALATQLAVLLAPFLPKLMDTTAVAGKKVVESVGEKVGEAAWNRAVSVWKMLRLEVEKEPILQDLAGKPNDPRAEALLSWQLEKLTLRPATLDKLQKIVDASKSEIHINSSTSGRSLTIINVGNVGCNIQMAELLELLKQPLNYQERNKSSGIEMLKRLLDADLNKFFDAIITAKNPTDRANAVRELKLHIDSVKTIYNMSDDVFDVFISDCIAKSEYIEPNNWIIARLETMKPADGMDQKTKQALLDFGINRFLGSLEK